MLTYLLLFFFSLTIINDGVMFDFLLINGLSWKEIHISMMFLVLLSKKNDVS